ncbi:MAG: hybrid sensor histidine kinase/response regulator, partial [Bacteroidales bacterium]|nr:hybrid sensor histidine kinase/response regulator [Bacteroidales bacterium]
TFHGLNRYNNYEFEQYFRSESEVSLQDSQIQDLLRDSKERLWIATVNGISLYNEQGNFTRIETPDANRNIIKLMEDKNGNILYSARNIIGKFDENDGRFNIFPISIPNFFALNTHIDAQNRLWGVEFNRLAAFNVESGELIEHFDIPFQTLYSYLYDNYLFLAGKGAMAIFDVNKMAFIPIPKNLAENQKLMDSQITLIGRLESNRLLINTDGHGLFCYNVVTGALQHQNDSDFPFNLPKHNIISFFTDSSGNLWIGTEDQGFIAKYKYDNRFQEHINLKTGLDGKSVTAMASDGERIWISTSADGFFVYDISSRMLYPQGNLSLEKDGIKFSAKEMIAGDNGTIWAAITSLNQIIECKWKNGKAEIIGRYFTMSPLSIAKGSDGSIWTGTISNTLSVLRPGEKNFHYIKVFGDNYTFIPALLPIEDGGIIVAGMMNPLVIVYPDGTITKLPIDDEEFKSCIKYVEFVPTALAIDKKGNLWIGTISNGLLKYDTKLNKLTSLTDVIEVSDISSIIEDAYGYIWISTIYGLFRLEPESMEVRSFYQYNGIGGNQFNERSVCRIDQEKIVFGGTHGISMMNLALQQEKHRVPICFDNLHIHNRLITANDYPEVIDKALSQNPIINLKHDQNSFSISFSALEYGSFNKVDYFYKMEGVDNYWIDAHNNREAYYSNIPAGRHKFSVRISSNDSSIAENEKSIIIKVKPAPWKSWWAYLIYILFIVCIIFAVTKTINDLHLAKLKASIAEDERQREMEITTMVKRFFANISHEFRTPLTMISAPVAQLYGDSNLPKEKRELISTIKRNSDRMLYLVEQIMDLGKIDNDVMRLEVCKKNISDVIARRIALFTLYAGEKRIKLQQHGLHAPIWLWVDEDKIDKIFCNLISNALKYTSMDGNICIELNILNGEQSFMAFPDNAIDKKMHYAVISVSNTGPIITENEREHIFERFYQIKNDSNVNYGTGIGLYYVKKMTLMHHGAIKVDNLEDNSGVKFSFAIPVEDSAYSEKEKISIEAAQKAIASES